MSLQSARDESERLKAALFDGALDCVVAIDDRGRVLEFNRAAEVTFGYTADEAIGSELADLVAPPDATSTGGSSIHGRGTRGWRVGAWS